MPIAVSPATLDNSKPILPVTLPQKLLSTQAIYAPAPWQYTVFSRLHELENQSAIGGGDDLKAAQSTIMFARTVIADLHDLNVPAPVVCPVSGGAVGMLWSLGSKQLEVVFAYDRSGSFILSEGDQVLGDGDLSPETSSDLESALRLVVSA